jgi:DNA-binding GntR family transcriptional regulator
MSRRPTHGLRRRKAIDELRDWVIDGTLAPGERLVELDLARRLRVSRTPVRDAIAQLASEGFLVPVRGALRVEVAVAPMEPDDLLELWALVAGVERAAVARLDRLPPATRRALAADLDRTNRQLEALTNARRADPARYRDLQRSFHDTLVDACGGPRIRAAHRALRPHISRYEIARARTARRASIESVLEHDRVIAAVRHGDVAAATAASTTHWDNAARRSAETLAPAPTAAQAPRARATA